MSHNQSLNSFIDLAVKEKLATEVNQNFSKAEMLAKEKKPKGMLVDLGVNPVIEMTDDEKIDFLWHAGFSTNTGLLLRN